MHWVAPFTTTLAISRISQFSKKVSLSGLRAIQAKIRQPVSYDLLYGDFFEMT